MSSFLSLLVSLELKYKLVVSQLECEYEQMYTSLFKCLPLFVLLLFTFFLFIYVQ